MDHKTFIERLAKASGIDKSTCNSLVEELAVIIGDGIVNEEAFAIPAFGSFEPRKRKERIMSHPSSPSKRLLVPPKLVISFKPSNILKNKINSLDE